MEVSGGARASSLRPVHKLSTPDVHYDRQLLRELEIANARARRDFGPLPPGGLPVQAKRKPKIPAKTWAPDSAPFSVNAAMRAQTDTLTTVPNENQEVDDMKLQILAVAAAVGAASIGIAQAYGADHGSKSATASAAFARGIPKEFHMYSSTAAGDGKNCVVGKVTDEDGMYARPYIYLAKATGGHVQWATFLTMPKDYYEGRATHCLRSGDLLYVLLQLDTQAPRSLNQTLLSIVKVRMNDGSTVGEVDVPVPKAHEPYTSWVWDDDGFRKVGDEILVTGKYRYMDTEDDLPFSTAIKM